MPPKYTKGDVLREIRRISQKHCEGGTPTNKDFREHAEMSSRMPSSKFGSWNQALKEAGLETKNDLSNLISLCPEHHKRLEGKFQESDYQEFISKSRGYLDV